ncbi:hypothetical protein [Glutamicibacter sp. NPDC087344]|uniref:hypothetical protein n=1 Tax=Glutamicibacter sp. NPDC087344 TaxID=3363994 RepID=UPI00382C9E07
MLIRARVTGVTLALLALAMTACSSTVSPPSLSVESVIDVCEHDNCFTAKVPAELSVIINGEEKHITSSDGSGSVTLDSSGAVQVIARWSSLEKKVDLLMSDGSAQSVTIKFDEAARIPAK